MPTDPLAQPDETPIPPSSLPPYTPPPVGSIPPPPVAAAGATTTGLEPNVAAGLATLVTFITGIIFLLIEKQSAYVRFWAMQSIVFGIAWFAVGIISAVIYGVLHAIFWPLGILWGLAQSIIYLGFLLAWIIMIIQAFSGKEWELPFLGKIARQQLARMPVT
jgi:uncharacterized membrane protein